MSGCLLKADHPHGPSQQDLPLAELFLRATSIVRQLESKPSPAPESRQLLQEGIRLLRLASQLVEAAGLFSPNEEKDDVATADLRVLLVPYYLGELLSQAGPGGQCIARQRHCGEGLSQCGLRVVGGLVW